MSLLEEDLATALDGARGAFVLGWRWWAKPAATVVFRHFGRGFGGCRDRPAATDCNHDGHYDHQVLNLHFSLLRRSWTRCK